MKSQLHLLLGLCLLICISCSDDDTVPNNSLAGANGFQFNNIAYITDNIYITQDNDILLSSRQVSEGLFVEEIDIASFSVSGNTLLEKSYNFGQDLTRCIAVTSAQWNEGTIEEGESILNEDTALSGFIRILDIDPPRREIEIIFEFERTDGELVAGSYVGTYQIADF